MEAKNKIKYEGILHLGDVDLNCYVLENGTRVLSSRSVQSYLKVHQSNTDLKEYEISGTELSRFLTSKWFNSLVIKRYDPAHFKPIICFKGRQQINGFEATVLIDMCDLILEARKAGVTFTERQQIVAEQCEILVRSFAKVGLIALIDEATGYQYERERDELQKILQAYISPQLLPWQKRFPNEFYMELFRLNGWDYTVKGIKKRPGVIGKWTKALVYEQLPPGVLEELEENTPKSPAGNYTVRFHQRLTEDVGNPHLGSQITQIITLFKLSDNMAHMWSQFSKLKKADEPKSQGTDPAPETPKWGAQLALPFDFDEKGHTIEPIDESTLSDFDKNLKKMLDTKPAK